MNSQTKPSRRNLMKWGLATAGLPIVAHALTASAEGISTAAKNSEPGGSIVTLPSGAQVFYREDWLGAPWPDGEPVLFLHGNPESSEIWEGLVPRAAQR